MTWQDLLGAAIQLSFGLAIVPTILAPAKPARWTCWHTASGLTALGIIFGTLGLWLTVVGVLSAATAWWVLVWQVERGSERNLPAPLPRHSALYEALRKAYDEHDDVLWDANTVLVKVEDAVVQLERENEALHGLAGDWRDLFLAKESAVQRAHDYLDDVNAQQPVPGCRWCGEHGYDGEGLRHRADCIILDLRGFLAACARIREIRTGADSLS